MKTEGSSRNVHRILSTLPFSVWTDEAGKPQFPDETTPDLSDEYFTWIDPSRTPEEGQYVLVSWEEKMFFDHMVQRDGELTLENHTFERASNSSVLILGVVVSGIEWFAIPEGE